MAVSSILHSEKFSPRAENFVVKDGHRNSCQTSLDICSNSTVEVLFGVEGATTNIENLVWIVPKY